MTCGAHGRKIYTTKFYSDILKRKDCFGDLEADRIVTDVKYIARESKE
jgi:hypothetical protein